MVFQLRAKEPINLYQRNGMSLRHVKHNRHQLYNHIKSRIDVLMTFYIDLSKIQASHSPQLLVKAKMCTSWLTGEMLLIHYNKYYELAQFSSTT